MNTFPHKVFVDACWRKAVEAKKLFQLEHLLKKAMIYNDLLLPRRAEIYHLWQENDKK